MRSVAFRGQQAAEYLLKGAGISVQAGIPDFRSPEGLFQSLKRDHPRDVLASGKDLFDASVFKVCCFSTTVVLVLSVLRS